MRNLQYYVSGKRPIAGPFDQPQFYAFQVFQLGVRSLENHLESLIHDLSYLYDDTTVNTAIPALRESAKYAVWELPSESYCGYLEQLCSEM